MYTERPSRLGGSVVWRRRTTASDARILPDGSLDLIWSSTGEMIVAGPDTTAHLYRGDAGRTLVGIRFAPGFGPRVLGVPADDVRDMRVPLDAIWPAAEVQRLAETVAESALPGRALEAIALQRLDGSDAVAGRIAEIAGSLRAGRSIASTADLVGMSERQLRRVSLAAFGYGPKTLARILRFGRAIELARAGIPFADAAAWSGYADQAHLARDVRSLAGVPLGRLVAESREARQAPAGSEAKRSTELPSGSWTMA